MDNQSVSRIDPLLSEKDNLDEGLHISLFGTFQIRLGDESFGAERFRLRKACSLIKLLALAPRHRLQRDQVLEWLWPDGDPEASANSLHQALRPARQALETLAHPCYIRFEDEYLSLQSDLPLWVDVEAFEATAAQAFQQGDPALYETAIALYTGELLPEDRYDDWAIHRRAALQQTCLDLLQGLAHLYEARREYPPAIAVYQRLIAMDALREDAHAGLMRLYALSGQRSQALRQYQILQDSLYRELEAEPDPVTERLHQQIRDGSYPPPDSHIPVDSVPVPRQEIPRHNLPAQLSSFIGREKEIAQVKALLAANRLVTLTGSGGVGKTRLALAAASQFLTEFEQGVWLVELAPLNDPELIPSTIAALFGLNPQTEKLDQGILNDYFRNKRLLLLLDNCEHLVQEAAHFTEALLQAAPGIKVLSTGREALGLAGETTYQVPSLETPDPLHLPPIQSLAQFDAVRLFTERANAALPAFALSESNAPAVAQICHRLDGIPLAIELAAARVKVLSAEHIAARLDDRFRLLTGGNRTAFPRHQTLHALIDWSYGLLSEPERLLFRCLSIFRSGWTLEAAEALCSCRDGGRSMVLEALSGLVNKSLVDVEMKGGEVNRYRMLESIRQYAQDKLLESGETAQMRDLHLAYFVTFAEAMEGKMHSPAILEALEQLDAEIDNNRLALDWAIGGGGHTLPSDSSSSGQMARISQGLRLACALAIYWFVRSLPQEGHNWLTKCLAISAEEQSLETLRAWAYFHAAELVECFQTLSFQLYSQSVALYRQSDDRFGLARASIQYGFLLADPNPKYPHPLDEAEGIARIEEGIALLEDLGDTKSQGFIYRAKARMAEVKKDYAAQRKMLEKSIACFEEAGDIFNGAYDRDNLMGLYWNEDFETAQRIAEVNLGLGRKLKFKVMIASALAFLGLNAYSRDDYAQAEKYFREGSVALKETGPSYGLVFHVRMLASALAHQGDIPQARRYFLESQSLGRNIRLGEQSGDPMGDLLFVAYMGMIAESLGQPALAARFLGAVEAIQETFYKPIDDVKDFNQTVVRVRSELDETSLTAAWTAGRKLTLEQALEEALAFCKNAG